MPQQIKSKSVPGTAQATKSRGKGGGERRSSKGRKRSSARRRSGQ